MSRRQQNTTINVVGICAKHYLASEEATRKLRSSLIPWSRVPCGFTEGFASFLLLVEMLVPVIVVSLGLPNFHKTLFSPKPTFASPLPTDKLLGKSELAFHMFCLSLHTNLVNLDTRQSVHKPSSKLKGTHDAAAVFINYTNRLLPLLTP
jgi:hypothetical protein